MVVAVVRLSCALSWLPWVLMALEAVTVLTAAGQVWVRRARQRRWQVGARLVTILAPPQPDPDGAAALWGNLAGLLRPRWRRLLCGQPHLCFEYHLTAHASTIRMWVPGPVPPGLVERAIAAAWPGATTHTTPAPPPTRTTRSTARSGRSRAGSPGGHRWGVAAGPPRRAAAGRARPRRPDRRPARHRRPDLTERPTAEPDDRAHRSPPPGGSAAAGGGGEEIVVQVLARPTPTGSAPPGDTATAPPTPSGPGRRAGQRAGRDARLGAAGMPRHRRPHHRPHRRQHPSGDRERISGSDGRGGSAGAAGTLRRRPGRRGEGPPRHLRHPHPLRRHHHARHRPERGSRPGSSRRCGRPAAGAGARARRRRGVRLLHRPQPLPPPPPAPSRPGHRRPPARARGPALGRRARRHRHPAHRLRARPGTRRGPQRRALPRHRPPRPAGETARGHHHRARVGRGRAAGRGAGGRRAASPARHRRHRLGQVHPARRS